MHLIQPAPAGRRHAVIASFLISILLSVSGCGEPSEASLLARAMQVHDQSIRSLRWTQTLVLEVGTPRALTRTSTQVIDDMGRWRSDFVDLARSASQAEPIEFRGRYAFDGVALSTFDSRGSGTIRAYENDRRTVLAVDCWWGRQVDPTGHRSLPEILLESTDLRIERFSDRHLPILACSAELGPLLASVEVEVDTGHGFAPRSIWIRDRLIRIPYDHFEVEAFEHVGGVWLPSRGTLATRKFQPTPEQTAALTAALDARSLPLHPATLDAATVASYHAALQDAFHHSEAPSLPMVPVLSIEAHYASVNEPIDRSAFDATYPREFLILDTLRDRVKKAGTDEWLPNSAPPRAVP